MRAGAEPTTPTSFGAAVDSLGDALGAGVRADIVASAYRDGSFAAALARLRTGMRTHAFRTATGVVDLAEVVAELDSATRREGFHVFLEWHEVAYRFIEEDIAVVLLDYVAGLEDAERSGRAALAVLLDFHFLYLLALCAMRAWDEGDGGAGLDRVTALVGRLNGAEGSGRRFAEGAEMLLWLAISTYEPDDLAYRRLLERVRALPPEGRLRMARVGGPLLGCHLRWGFPHLYERDLPRMRADNFVDYPWLFFCVAELVGEYERLRDGPDAERRAVAGALLNALSPDPDALLGEPPPSLEPWRAEHDRVRAQLGRHAAALRADFERLRPGVGRYSPLGFHFNFPHNAIFALAVLGCVAPDTPDVALDGLVTADVDGPAAAAAAGELAARLTGFAAANPEPRGDRTVLGLYYDAEAALAAHQDVLAALAPPFDPGTGAG